MAKYAIALLSDKEKLTLFKHQAYEYACRFDVHKIVPAYEEMYQKALA